MKRGRGSLSKTKRRERGRCSVTYASSQVFYNHVPLRQTRFLGCSGWKNDFSTYSSDYHRHAHTANRRHDNIYATAALDIRTHGAMAPRSRPINSERCSATVRGPEPNPYFPRLKKLPNVSLARWLGGMRFDHHNPSLKEEAGLCQAAPRRVLFQGAEVL